MRVFEKRTRAACESTVAVGPSTVSLSLSARGMRALHAIGADRAIARRSVEMDRRVLHLPDGTSHEKTYGAPERVNYAVTRGELTAELIGAAETLPDVSFEFSAKCHDVDPGQGTLRVGPRGEVASCDLLVGADGTRSAVRSSYLSSVGFNYRQEFFPAGYVEVPLNDDQLCRSAIHIWRGRRPLVGLPARDGSIKGTLVLPIHGSESWDALTGPDALVALLARIHPTLCVDREALRATFASQRCGRMVTIVADPYILGRSMLIGDAAHAMCPFMGQGVNAGLEDVAVFLRIFDEAASPAECLEEYSRQRAPEGKAAAELSLWNYTELGGELQEATVPSVPSDLPPIVLVNFFHMTYAAVLHAARLQGVHRTRTERTAS